MKKILLSVWMLVALVAHAETAPSANPHAGALSAAARSAGALESVHQEARKTDDVDALKTKKRNAEEELSSLRSACDQIRPGATSAQLAAPSFPFAH